MSSIQFCERCRHLLGGSTFYGEKRTCKVCGFQETMSGEERSKADVLKIYEREIEEEARKRIDLLKREEDIRLKIEEIKSMPKMAEIKSSIIIEPTSFTHTGALFTRTTYKTSPCKVSCPNVTCHHSKLQDVGMMDISDTHIMYICYNCDTQWRSRKI